MTPERTPAAQRRIAVTLEASETGRPLLETCVRLAALLDAELEGIFIEDSNLLRLAGLSFLREVRPSSLGEESVNVQRMQRELRSLARQAEHMLEQAAREMGVTWSFQVWRGTAGAETLSRTFPADVLGLGRVSARAPLRLRAMAGMRTHRTRPLLTSISVLFSVTESAARALDTAARLATELDTGLTVLLPGTATAEIEALRERAATLLAARSQTARFVALDPATTASLPQAAVHTGTGLLVTEAAHPLFDRSGLESCLATLPCPVLLVR